MLGNDIVDLCHPDALDAVENRRFQERVFSAEELSWLHLSTTADDLAANLWSAWACKESAYKALRSRIPDLPFHWNRFIVSSDFSAVTHPVGRCSCRVTRGEGWVHAVALDRFTEDEITGDELAESKLVQIGDVRRESQRDHPVRCWKTRRGRSLYLREAEMDRVGPASSVDENRNSRESILSRELALQLLAATGFDAGENPLSDSRLHIVRENGSPPRFAEGNRILAIPLSLSHHGRYVAAALLL